jgi:hypothetical protein
MTLGTLIVGQPFALQAKMAWKYPTKYHQIPIPNTWGSGPLLHMACMSLIRFNWFLCKKNYFFHRDVSFGE